MAEPQHTFASGDPVWYQSSTNGRLYAGVVHVHLKDARSTVSLRDMDVAYSIDAKQRPGVTYVSYAAHERVFPRKDPRTCGEPGCLCTVQYDPQWATDVRDQRDPEYCSCGVNALRAALRQATRDRDGWRKSFEHLTALVRTVVEAREKRRGIGDAVEAVLRFLRDVP